MSHEVIDVEEWDVFCTGVRHYVRIDLPPTPRKKRQRTSTTISLLDSDPEDAPVASSSRAALSQENSHSPTMNHGHDQPLQRTQLQNQTELALRSALNGGPPSKRPATDAVKMALNAINRNNLNLKRKESVAREGKEQEVIVLSSDSETEGLPPKRQRVEDDVKPKRHASAEEEYGDTSEALQMMVDDVPPELPSSPQSEGERANDSDEDDDYINFLASLDISNENNWAPLPESKKAEDLTPVDNPDSDIPKQPSLPHLRIPKRRRPVDREHLPSDWCSSGLWGLVARNHGIQRFPKPWYHTRRQEHVKPLRAPSLYHEQGYSKLELTAKYPHLASGSISKIIQEQGTVILGAVVEAGAPDYSDDEDEHPPPPPENKAGSLVVYRHGRVYVTQAHYRTRPSTRGQIQKYYSVNDLAFDPSNPEQFLSSGGDFTVQLWKLPDGDHGENQSLRVIQTLDFDDIPQDLVYSPNCSALAVSCHDGTLRLFNSHDLFVEMMVDTSPKKLYVAPKHSGHAAGSFVWGSGPTENLIFTSSEPVEETDFGGYHHVFDAHKGIQVMQLDSTESGDAAALSPDGTTLVLFTRGADNAHPVRLYDVRRKSNIAYETEELERFRTRPPTGLSQDSRETQEVNCAAFSPDGMLLAVARSDNMLHIYDVRALPKGPLCRFIHHDSDAVGGGGYGIVSAKWIQGRQRLGVMTGGNDGCVRLWEPALGRRSELQGMVLGRTDFDVGHFSVGDRHRGEHSLVIGDSGGGMHTYDFTNPDGVPL